MCDIANTCCHNLSVILIFQDSMIRYRQFCRWNISLACIAVLNYHCRLYAFIAVTFERSSTIITFERGDWKVYQYELLLIVSGFYKLIMCSGEKLCLKYFYKIAVSIKYINTYNTAHNIEIFSGVLSLLSKYFRWIENYFEHYFPLIVYAQRFQFF